MADAFLGIPEQFFGGKKKPTQAEINTALRKVAETTDVTGILSPDEVNDIKRRFADSLLKMKDVSQTLPVLKDDFVGEDLSIQPAKIVKDDIADFVRDSVLKQDDNKPMIFYHGTKNNFDQFSDDYK
jgi:hypothetical protein